MAQELDIASLAEELGRELPQPHGQESPRDLHDAYERDVQALGAVAQAAPLIYAQGRLLEDRLGQPEKAAECYGRALERDPTYLPAIHAARRLHSEIGNWTHVAQLLALEAKVTADRETLAAIHFERALIFEEKLNDGDKAREAFAEARAADPKSYVLDAMYYRSLLGHHEFERAYEVLDGMAAEIEDDPFRADLHRQLAALAGPRLNNHEVSLTHERAVLERDPSDPSARAVLIVDLERGDKRVMAETLAKLARTSIDGADAAALHYRAARVFRDHLSEEERAVSELQEALDREPVHALSLSELGAIFEASQRWTELCDVLRREAQLCQAVEDRAHRLFRLGQVFEEKLGNDAAALDHYRRVVELRPGYLPALQALGKLYSRTGAWSDLADMYEAEILATGEPALKVSKLFKLAEIAEVRLNNSDRAVQLYEQMLNFEPGYLPALKALGRLYGNAGRWRDLVTMYENELQAAQDDEQRIELLERVGQTYEERLDDPDRAIAAYQRLLALSPGNVRAIRTLAQLYLRTERYRELIEVNEQEIGACNDQKKIISLLHKNGEIYEDKLNDKEKAIDCYRQLLALVPNYLPALRSLGRLYLHKGRWQELAAMYRQEIEVTSAPEQIATLQFKIGELLHDKLLEENGAIDAFRAVLKEQPTHTQAIAALTRLYRAREMWSPLEEVLRHEAEGTNDPAQRVARWCEVGFVREDRLKDADGAIVAYERALDADPANALARANVARLLELRHDAPRLLKLYETAVPLIREPAQKLSVLLRLGRIYEQLQGDVVKATAAYEGALGIEPEHVPALLALVRLSLERRDYRRTIALLEQLAQMTADSRLAVSFHLQAAAIKENHLEPAELGVDNYRAILALDPSNAHALRALEVALHKAHDWQGLQSVYQRWSSGLRGTMAGAWLVERAELALETQDPELASLAEPLEEVVRDEPSNLRAIRVLRRLYDRIDNWQGFLQATELEGRLTQDKVRAARLLTDVGNVQWHRLKDAALAKKTLKEAMARDPSNLGPFLALSEVLTAAQEWRELAVLLAERGGTRGEFLVEAGAIYFSKLGEPDTARDCFEAALSRDPTRSDAHVALAEMAEKGEDWLRAVEHYSRGMTAQATGDQLARLHARLARIYAMHLGDPTRAVSHVRAALAAGPLDNTTFELAVEVLSCVGDFSAATTALTKLIERADDNEERARLYCQLGSLHLSGLKDDAGAMRAFEAAQQLAPAGGVAIERLIEIYERTGRWQRLVELLGDLLPKIDDRKAKARMQARLAGVHAEHMKNYSQAAVEMKQAVMLDPDEPAYRERLGLFLSTAPSTLGDAAAQFRGLLDRDPWRTSAIRALCRLSAQQNLHDRAVCFAEVLTFLRAADAEEEAFFAQHREAMPKTASSELGPADLLALYDRDERSIAALLQPLGGELLKVYSPRIDLQAFDKSARLTGKSADPTRALADTIARALGVEDYLLVVGGREVDVDDGDPPVLALGADFLRRVAPSEQRYLLGEHLFALRAGHQVLRRDVGDLSSFLSALCHAAAPDSDTALVEPTATLAQQLGRVLSRKAKRALEEPARTALLDRRRFDTQPLLSAVARSELRAGVLFAGDFASSARLLAKRAGIAVPAEIRSQAEAHAVFSRVPGFVAALVFFLSEEHFALRQRLGLAI